MAADERLHRHLQALEVTLLEINGWHSRCFEITQAHHWPAVLQQVFVLPPIESSRDGLLIGKLTISCLDNDKHVTGHDDIDQNNSDATQSPVITITST